MNEITLTSEKEIADAASYMIDLSKAKERVILRIECLVDQMESIAYNPKTMKLASYPVLGTLAYYKMHADISKPMKNYNKNAVIYNSIVKEQIELSKQVLSWYLSNASQDNITINNLKELINSAHFLEVRSW